MSWSDVSFLAKSMHCSGTPVQFPAAVLGDSQLPNSNPRDPMRLARTGAYTHLHVSTHIFKT